jgi:zinc protease
VSWCLVRLAAVPLYRDSLPNGLIVLTYEDHRLPVADLRLVCRSGSEFDPAGKAGTAALTAQLLLRGTKHLSADSFSGILEDLGAEFDASGSFDGISLTMRVLTKDVPEALDLIQDATLSPLFDPKEFELARQQALTGARRVFDNPNGLVRQEFDRLLFGAGPFGAPASGDTMSLMRLTRDDLVACHKTHFKPNNCFFIAVGDVRRGEVLEQVRSRFGLAASSLAASSLAASSPWPAGDVPALPVPAPTFPEKLRVKLIPGPDMSQTYVIFGHPGITMNDSDMLETRVMSYILGGSPLSSRLGMAVREKEGLAYDVRCWFERTKLRNAFRATVQTAKPAEAIKLMRDQVRKMHDSGATQAELDKARNFYTGSFPLLYSSGRGKLGQVTEIETYHLGSDWLDRFPERVKAITLSGVNAAATRRLRPEQYIMVIMGNVKKEDLGLEGVEWIE